ncbi:hypothetical protein C8F04DRAFT_1016399 [Mycena alexandri]|uniref:BZIP domain-containing protein n=1 Tax=Mycena alexandri TaxID=1745969 RepID=A0AAD6S0P9_9AGAR|nr:hypothetical protein C8F04DRAFT_1016399 [Mycena alexandri]
MTSLSMAHLISSDAPLLSPVDYPQYSPVQDSYAPYAYYSSSSSSSIDGDSPVPAPRMLKLPANDSLHCVPTHQLFDFPQVSPSPSEPPSPSHHQPRLSISINPVGCKRSASPEPAIPKKRAVGERISSKDFVPPDVSGLSKREARLVKNRAAAFLSRQRKREEFELMEVRVAELEQENARLLEMAKGGSPSTAVSRSKQSDPNDALVSEIEQLRAQLQAAEKRERELNAELTAKSASRDVPLVKIEPSEPSFALSPAPRMQSPHKSAASLGLMVLLCALPSLLSMPSASLPTSFSLPHSLPPSSSAFDFNSFLPNEYDWPRSGSSGMEMDADDKPRVTDTSTTSTTRKLEFSDADSGALAGLGGLDISFDASPLDDGKIRVRIHPSSSASSRAPSPGGNYATKQDAPLTMWFGSEPDPNTGASLPSESYAGGYSTSSSDPFLGVGGYGSPYSSSSSPFMYSQDDISSVDYSESDLGVPSEYSVADSTTGGKRRVRIALKSMPASGGEGGEWEVQFC